MKEILLFTGLFVYLLNYAIGWAIYFRKIVIGKNMHRLLLSLIIINMSVLLIFIPLFSSAFILCSISLISMMILPLGKKGGIYHRTISSIGVIIFLVFFIISN